MVERKVTASAESAHDIPEDVRAAYDLVRRNIIVINKDRVIEYCNKMVKDEKGDVTGEKCYSVFCGADSPPDDCPLLDVIESSSERSRVVKRGANYLYVSLSPFPLIEPGDRALCLSTDITDMVSVGKKAKESQDLLRNIFNSIGDPITIHSPDYTILDANIAALNLLGLKKGDVVGKKCYEVFHHTDSPVPVCPLRQTLLKGDMESAMVGPPDMKGYYVVNTAPVFGTDGEIVRIVHLLKDVTELKEMEKELTMDNERLLMFSDLITHDMGNYSQGALLAVDMLLTDESLSPRQKRYLEMARAQMQSASHLLDNARKLSRLYEESIRPVPVDAGIMIMKAVSQLKKTYAGRVIQVNTEVKMGTHTVLADDLLFDVFLNILGNAIKYTKSDPVIINIVADTVEDDPSIYRFEIIDRAGGIPDEYKDGIFNRFKRLNNRSSGSGLGLTLAKRIVMNYGGNLWVEDFKVDGEIVGSVFVILLNRG